MYFYHGYALGVASTIKDRQFTKGVCALSVRGGSAFARESAFKSTGTLDISFDFVESSVSGVSRENNGVHSWITDAAVVIQGLRIADKTCEFVKAERVEVHIVSEYRVGDNEASVNIAEGRTRCGFEKLQILGNQVQLEDAEDMFTRYLTYSSMQQDFGDLSTHARLMDCVLGRYLDEADANTKDLSAAYKAYTDQDAHTSLKPAVVCSLVKAKKVAGGNGGIKTWGPIITVPDFGTIYLGELIVWPWMRCLTMFRIELASGDTISGGSVGTNGTGFPPGAYSWP